ncbi:hypothetical protein NA56DRAFT_710938 [Hyaloscypha hepaticicola]|uniref:NACHT domain-containing protein n=1 Tax=Hyaloscypha hepaticicola TaxID=2082293 RepID=A0A2J6PK00_9HELO|nr:hypothetical protein NA56DRAFT_710938 [Hyaloscypha hepaticicola]
MDPLTALSIAGTIVRFVDFALKILTTGHQLYNSSSGSIPAHDELKLVGRDLSVLATKLDFPARTGGTHDDAFLEDLCAKCESIAQELIDHLKKLKRQEKKGPMKSFRLSLKVTWDQKDLGSLIQRLQSLENSLESWFLNDIGSRIDSENIQKSERFARLDDESQNIVSALLDVGSSLPDDLLDQRKAVAQMLDRLDLLTSSPNRSVLATGESSVGELSAPIENSRIGNLDRGNLTQVLENELGIKQKVGTFILETLKFSMRNDLQEDVPEARHNTLKRIFEPQEDKPWSCFASWLKTGDGIYWINGKAGSGKSTLMRYIYDNPRTRQELSQWAAPTALSMPGFFFQSNGTKEQRSQLGLLRALLYEVLEGSRDLIPVVLPWLWAKRYSQALDPLTPHPPEKPLVLSNLLQAFTVLAQQTKIPFRFCFFIDGLDEYEGDSEKIVKIFERLSRSPIAKICVSSRPLLVFEDAFSKSPGLKLQDLTSNDIKKHVKKELTSIKRYQQLAADESVPAAALEQEIVSLADGVFLWVRLVLEFLESLLSGLGNENNIGDLQSRLRMLPTDLEELYHHILKNKIDPIYMDDASKMFKIMQKTSGSELSILAFALTDESYFEKATNGPTRPWKEEEISSACQKMEDRMKTRCAGLIGVSGTVTDALYDSSSRANGKVQYLHRTVKDYLERLEFHKLIASHLKKLQFDANISLLQSSLLQLKIIPKHNEIAKFWNLAREAMQYASAADLSTDSHMALVHELGRTIKEYRKTSTNFYPEKWSESFLAVAVQYNLWPYVEKQLSSQAFLKQGVTVRTLLAYALGARGFHNYDIEHNKEMVEILLKHATKNGTSPGIFKTSTMWEQVLQALEERFLEEEFFVRQFEVVRIFLECGADPLAKCILKDGRELSADTIIREGLTKYPHPATEDILRILDFQEALVNPKKSVIKRFSSWSSRKPRLENKRALI